MIESKIKYDEELRKRTLIFSIRDDGAPLKRNLLGDLDLKAHIQRQMPIESGFIRVSTQIKFSPPGRNAITSICVTVEDQRIDYPQDQE